MVSGLEPSRGLVGGCSCSLRKFPPGRRGVLRVGPRGTGMGVPEDGVCWHGR